METEIDELLAKVKDIADGRMATCFAEWLISP